MAVIYDIDKGKKQLLPPPSLLGQSMLKPCLGLLTSCCGPQNNMLETCKLLVGVSIGDPSKSH